MEIYLNDSEIHLKENSPIRLRNAAGQRITCTAGTIWITVAGDTSDIFLTSGETCHVQGDGLALVEAVGAGSILIGRQENFPALRTWIGRLRSAFALPGTTVSQPSEAADRTATGYSIACAASRSRPSFRS